MSLRAEVVSLMQQEGVNVSEVCRRFEVSRKTAYKWLARAQAQQPGAFADRSRRPKHSPRVTTAGVVDAVVKLRSQHPAWGGRKVKRRLEDLGHKAVPAASTIHAILRREGLLDPAESANHRAFQRFEHEAPNELWQMDFKGHFALQQGRCHALTLLDDHSRYALGLAACANERTDTVQEQLVAVFRRYGLPWRILCDNGPPWGDPFSQGHTALTLWLLRMSVAVSHGRPYHPQTQGKDERFHRTLKAELLDREPLVDLTHCQRRFDRWRHVYNHERPHEALGMAAPATRYRISSRPYPESLPPIEYAPGVAVRKVQAHGIVHFQGREYRVGKVFTGYPLGLRPTLLDGMMEVLFCEQVIYGLDLRSGIATKPVTYVSEHMSPVSPV